MFNFSVSECFEDRDEPVYFVLGGKKKSFVSSLNLCTNVRGCYSIKRANYCSVAL